MSEVEVLEFLRRAKPLREGFVKHVLPLDPQAHLRQVVLLAWFAPFVIPIVWWHRFGEEEHSTTPTDHSRRRFVGEAIDTSGQSARRGIRMALSYLSDDEAPSDAIGVSPDDIHCKVAYLLNAESGH